MAFPSDDNSYHSLLCLSAFVFSAFVSGLSPVSDFIAGSLGVLSPDLIFIAGLSPVSSLVVIAQNSDYIPLFGILS